MRKPRPEKFDPNYQPKTTSKPEEINVVGVVPIKPMPSSKTNKTVRTENRSEFRTEERSENRSFGFPTKRSTKRYSFEFYEDQIIRIKQIKIQAEMSGKRLNMSEIVRLALDDYFDRQPIEPFGKPFARNSERTEERSENRTQKSPT